MFAKFITEALPRGSDAILPQNLYTQSQNVVKEITEHLIGSNVILKNEKR